MAIFVKPTLKKKISIYLSISYNFLNNNNKRLEAAELPRKEK